VTCRKLTEFASCRELPEEDRWFNSKKISERGLAVEKKQQKINRAWHEAKAVVVESVVFFSTSNCWLEIAVILMICCSPACCPKERDTYL
jgi:hypothetical protein